MSDVELSEQARALVDAGRGLYMPTDDDTAKVHARLLARLALPVVGAAAAGASAGSAKTAGAASLLGAGGKVALAVIVTAMTAWVTIPAHRRQPDARPSIGSVREIGHSPESRAHAEPVPTANPLVAPDPITVPTAVTNLQPVARVASPSRAPAILASPSPATSRSEAETVTTSPSPVAQLGANGGEIRIGAVSNLDELPAIDVNAPPPTHLGAASTSYERAQMESLRTEQDFIHAARIAMATRHLRRAIELLDEHARRFPNGDLVVARLTDRVLVDCMLGHHDDARRDAIGVLRRESVGPHADIVHGSCVGQSIDGD